MHPPAMSLKLRFFALKSFSYKKNIYHPLGLALLKLQLKCSFAVISLHVATGIGSAFSTK